MFVQCSGPTYVKLSSSLLYAIRVKFVRSGSMHLTFRVRLSKLPASIPEDPDVMLLAWSVDELLPLLLELLELVELVLGYLELLDVLPVEELLVVLYISLELSVVTDPSVLSVSVGYSSCSLSMLACSVSSNRLRK